MKCPQCPETILVMTERQGVEIDYCPNCRGVWLDRGELDKLTERAATNGNAATASRPSEAASPTHNQHNGHRDFQDSDHNYVRGGPYVVRKKSWLNDIFD
jgi:uncharacterized protein